MNDIVALDLDFHAPAHHVKEGRRTYYRYQESSYTIFNNEMSEDDINKLGEALPILDKFEGLSNFDWVSDLWMHIRSSNLMGDDKAGSVVEFEHNPYLHGREWISLIFNSIVNKQTLDIRLIITTKDAKPSLLQ